METRVRLQSYCIFAFPMSTFQLAVVGAYLRGWVENGLTMYILGAVAVVWAEAWIAAAKSVAGRMIDIKRAATA